MDPISSVTSDYTTESWPFFSNEYTRIYRGICKSTKDQVVVKKSTHKRSNVEVDILKRSNHPNVIRMYSHYTEDKTYVIVLEYVETDLVEYINTHMVDIKTVANIFKQVLEAVKYIHSLLIAHHDIKPDNLLLTNDMVVKLIDFNLSESFTEKPCMSRYCSGTESYRPSEILKVCRYYDALKADMYSVGVVLHTLVFRTLPEQLHKRHVAASRSNKFIVINDMVDALLHIDPNMRPSAEELLEHEWFTKPEEKWYNLACNWITNNPILRSYKRRPKLKSVTKLAHSQSLPSKLGKL